MKKDTKQAEDPGSEEEESYEVEKIVNHRSINGKKEYKVIWVGYGFDEATWQPEENLKCPEKIKEFQKRYDDVIKKKKLMMSNASTGRKQQGQKTPEQNQEKSADAQKVPKDKPQAVQPQKSQINSANLLDREKLATSIQKVNGAPPKKSSQIETLKSKIMNPQKIQSPQAKTSEQLKINIQSGQVNQPKQVLSTSDLFAPPRNLLNLSNDSKMNSSKDSLNGSLELSNAKLIEQSMVKLQHQGQKTENVEKKPVPKFEESREEKTLNFISRQQKQNQNSGGRLRDLSFEINLSKNEEERKISSYSDSRNMAIQEQNPKDSAEYPDLFLQISERMDIEKIVGICDQGIEENSVFESNEGLRSWPEFVLIKNKFSDKEKWVEKERIIQEDPMKLIAYYESLLTAMMSS